MPAWIPIAGLIAFTLVWPFVDIGIRNGIKRRARGRQQAQNSRIADA